MSTGGYEHWKFWVEQGGMIVAEGESDDFHAALRECKHYCAMYGQDGPVEGVVQAVCSRDRSRDGEGEQSEATEQ